MFVNGSRSSSSGVNTSSESFPKSHSHYSELSDTHTPFSVELTPDSGIVATPVSQFKVIHEVSCVV